MLIENFPRKVTGMNRRTELMRSVKSARKLFVVDIENAVGIGKIDEASCLKVKNRIEQTYNPQPYDLTVIGVSHKGNIFPASAWAGARLVIKEGHNGADLALENVLANENVENRFGEVVIVSGDGLFAAQAARLRSLDVKVTVDARARQLARILAFSCSTVTLAPNKLAA